MYRVLRKKCLRDRPGAGDSEGGPGFLKANLIVSRNKFERGGPGQSRTADQRFRKPLLYPSELRGRRKPSIDYRMWFRFETGW